MHAGRRAVTFGGYSVYRARSVASSTSLWHHQQEQNTARIAFLRRSSMGSELHMVSTSPVVRMCYDAPSNPANGKSVARTTRTNSRKALIIQPGDKQRGRRGRPQTSLSSHQNCATKPTKPTHHCRILPDFSSLRLFLAGHFFVFFRHQQARRSVRDPPLHAQDADALLPGVRACGERRPGLEVHRVLRLPRQVSIGGTVSVSTLGWTHHHIKSLLEVEHHIKSQLEVECTCIISKHQLNRERTHP